MKSICQFCVVDEIIKSEKYDYLIIDKGTEERAYTFIEQFVDKEFADTIVVCDYPDKKNSFSSAEVQKYDSISEIFSRKMIQNAHTITIENAQVGRALTSVIKTSSPKVAVDISEMNFWELSDLLFFLIKVANVGVLDVFYTTPGQYQYENNNISRYSHRIEKVSYHYPKQYYSTNMLDNEVFVAILGFQKRVSKLMQDLLDVSDYYAINGFPSSYPKAKDISMVNNYDYLSEVAPDHRFSSEAINPFICYNTLLDVRKKSNGAFMNVCPMSSKPMTLGACLFTLKYPNTTRLVYPFPESVFTIAEGVGHTYRYRIDREFFS